MKIPIFLISTLPIFLFDISFAAPNKVVCYYGSWAVYRPGKGKFDIENIDPTLCTHLIYSFVGIGEDGSVKVLDAQNDLDDNGGHGGFKRFNNLRKKASNLKTLVAIGGWSAGGSTFSKVIDSDSLRVKFVKNVVNFVKKYDFNGFDLDWEYPAASDRGGKPQDVENFSKLIKELRAEFKPFGFLLSAAVAASEDAFTKYYQVPELSKYLDWINVMTYDLHGSWDGVTGFNAPLYPANGDSSPDLNVKACIEAWISHGADPNKLVMGMGMYGRSFTLANSKNHGVGAKTTGPGKQGPYTGEAGTLGYNEIVEDIKNNKLTVVWDDTQKCPYGYNGNQWVGYDNDKSIQLKCEYAKQKNLGGGMIWSIDTDDFLGTSGIKYQLLKKINSVFGRAI